MNLDLIASIITSIATGVIGFLAGKKRSDAEVEAITIKNIESALAIYQELLNDMKSRYDAEIDGLKKKLTESQTHITSLENQIKQLKRNK
jgi:archaellum component FlaC